MKRNHDMGRRCYSLSAPPSTFSQTFGIRKIAILPVRFRLHPRICVVFMSALTVMLIVQGVGKERKIPRQRPPKSSRRKPAVS
jgi:hypothetical protein